MVDQRVDVLDHQLQLRINVVREAFAAQDAGQDALAVEDVLSDQHRVLLQMADARKHLLVDRVAQTDLLAQRRDVLRQRLDQVGIEVDTNLQNRNQQMIARRESPIVHLQPLSALGEGSELVEAHRHEHALGDDERHGLDAERVAGRHEKVRVADDRVLGFGILRRTFDFLDLLPGLEIDLHEILDGFLLLDRRREQIDPEDVVVAQIVEQPDVGVAYDLVILLEVYRNHVFGR